MLNPESPSPKSCLLYSEKGKWCMPTKDRRDSWRWKESKSGGYQVNKVYQLLHKRSTGNNAERERVHMMIWENEAAPKCKIHAWRVLRSCVSTASELHKRRSLPLGASLNCALCKTVPEEVQHLFFECQCVQQVWKECLQWMGVQAPFLSNPKGNFVQFAFYSSRRKRIMAARIWVCVVWLVWKGRNETIFKNGEWNPAKITAEIKAQTWSWYAWRKKTNWGAGCFSSWKSNPRSCL